MNTTISRIRLRLAWNMNTASSNARSAVRWPLVLAVLITLVALEAHAAVDCEPFKWQEERLDVTAANDQLRISQIEGHHFDADTENLIRGMTGSIGADIDFLVRYAPNHHRGLAALVRLALKDKTPKPSGVQIPVECYLLRALEFKPSDPEVHKIYATYLARLNRNSEALATFGQAEKLSPNDPVIAYNMGLLLTEQRDFERARAYAKKAYAGGIEFPGLRDRLARQGQWR